jgi:hypothetical protein
MRVMIPFLLLLIASASAQAQTATVSGATSNVYVNNPSNFTSKDRLLTSPNVTAPALAAAGIESCLGSVSGSLSVMGTGVSFGRSITDKECDIRLTARQLRAFGHPGAALALLCQDQHIAAAMASVGDDCPGQPLRLVGAQF